jgi:hypothetical protein
MLYYVNKNPQSNGDHEVHNETCRSPRCPLIENREQLGNYYICYSAVAEAKRRGYRTANGCAYCSPSCHTQ